MVSHVMVPEILHRRSICSTIFGYRLFKPAYEPILKALRGFEVWLTAVKHSMHSYEVRKFFGRTLSINCTSGMGIYILYMLYFKKKER